jgi:hypothetical protein
MRELMSNSSSVSSAPKPTAYELYDLAVALLVTAVLILGMNSLLHLVSQSYTLT